MSKNVYVTTMTKSAYNRQVNKGVTPRCYSCDTEIIVGMKYATQKTNRCGIKRRCIPCAERVKVI